jgi:hypothetical protein
MSVSGNRPLSHEEKCTLYSISSEDYFRCLKSSQIQLFQSPKQQLPTWAIVLIVIGMIAAIGVSIYIVRKSDKSSKIRPL